VKSVAAAIVASAFAGAFDWLRGADESAHDLPFNLVGETDVQPGAGEQGGGIVARVDARRFNARILESDGGE